MFATTITKAVHAHQLHEGCIFFHISTQSAAHTACGAAGGNTALLLASEPDRSTPADCKMPCMRAGVQRQPAHGRHCILRHSQQWRIRWVAQCRQRVLLVGLECQLGYASFRPLTWLATSPQRSNLWHAVTASSPCAYGQRQWLLCSLNMAMATCPSAGDI